MAIKLANFSWQKYLIYKLKAETAVLNGITVEELEVNKDVNTTEWKRCSCFQDTEQHYINATNDLPNVNKRVAELDFSGLSFAPVESKKTGKAGIALVGKTRMVNEKGRLVRTGWMFYNYCPVCENPFNDPTKKTETTDEK